MRVSDEIKSRKISLRKTMRKQRDALKQQNTSPNLFDNFPPLGSFSPSVAGYAAIGTELNIWPLLSALHDRGQSICLPVIVAPNHPLTFRSWTPLSEMKTDRYGVAYPAVGKTFSPDLIFVPLLAFTAKGERLGYGGGYYDRTLEVLRQKNEIFACGVAYAGQEVESLPTDMHDAKLDGILTENGFKAFA